VCPSLFDVRTLSLILSIQGGFGVSLGRDLALGIVIFLHSFGDIFVFGRITAGTTKTLASVEKLPSSLQLKRISADLVFFRPQVVHAGSASGLSIERVWRVLLGARYPSILYEGRYVAEFLIKQKFGNLEAKRQSS